MFYIYEKSSTYIMGKMDKNGVVRPDHRKSYATMSAAKAALTKMTNWHRYHTINDMQNSPQFRYAIAEVDHFHTFIEKSVVKRNAMNGNQFVEKVNTPYYCSPSSETYWSM